jgi:hypothetical protein
MFPMNLYMVLDEQYEWCCFIFAHTRNEAKAMWARCFDQEYTGARCKTLEKGVDFPMCKCVDNPDDPDYGYVLGLGYEYKEDA